MTQVPILRTLSAEILKYKRTLALWLAILAPLFLVTLNFLIFWLRDTPMVAQEANAWQVWGLQNLNPSAFLLFPMFVTLLAVFFFQIEHQNNSWKHLWVLPIPRIQQYLAKVVVLLGLIGISLIVFFLLIALGGTLLGVLRPDLGFQEDIGLWDVAYQIGYSGAASLSLIALQFWFSFRWRSLLAPLALGLGGLISANIIISWEHSAWHPYTSSMLSLTSLRNPDVQLDIDPLLYSVALGITVFVVAYYEGRNRLLRG